jgi:hypothetical protein
MPPELVRPGIQVLRETGMAWQREKLNDLAQTFGHAALVGRPTRSQDGTLDFGAIPLEDALPRIQVGQFVVEGRLDVTGTFERALLIDAYRGEFDLEYSDLRPDLILVLPAG